MNLLEQYIKEIHSEVPYEAEWMSKFPDKKFVKVDVTTDCYGRLKRAKHIFDTKEWARYKTQGYWMA